MVSFRPPSRLLERDQQVALLREAWQTAVAGHGSLWLVRAEAGGGKTRLLGEAATWGRTLWGAAEPVFPPEPFLALTAALPGFTPAATRAGTLARLAERLNEERTAGPLLLVLDDLHWADDGTVAALVRLAAICRERPWLVLAAFRPGEGTEALRLAGPELVAQGRARTLDLPPLSPAAVAALARQVRGAALSRAETEAIATESGGNPWLVETLAGPGGAAAAGERVSARISALDRRLPGTRRLLCALAPAGGPLPHPVVVRVAGGDEPAARALLSGLRDADLLREEGGAWQFRHELLRSAVLGSVLDAERREAHRLLAEALEGTANAAHLSMHYAEAGDPRAYTWAVRAADEAGDVDAHAESLAQAERALSFAGTPAEQQYALRLAVRATFRLGRFEESRRLAEAATALPGGEPELRALLHRSAANAARRAGDFVAAGRHMEQAELTLAEQPISIEKVTVAVARILEAYVAGSVRRTEARAVAALEMLRDLDDPEAATGFALEANSYLGLARLTAGDPAGFISFEQIAALPRDDSEQSRNVVVGMSNAYEAAVLGLFHHEADRFRACLEAGVQRHDLGRQELVTPYRALDLAQRGAYAEARALLAVDPPDERTAEFSVRQLAAVLLEARAGAPRRARALVDTTPWTRAPLYRFLHDLAWLAAAELEEQPDADGAAERYAWAENRRNARPAAMAAVLMARGGLEAPEPPDWLAGGSPLRVFWFWARARAERDTAALREVAARLAALACPHEAALALADAGDLTEAYRALREIEAGAAREMVAARLRAAGLPVPRRPREQAAEDGLTETELAVCRLLATGARNEQIAEALNIGVRTVETHLTRLYQKTGQRGRTALAAWWMSRDRPERL